MKVAIFNVGGALSIYVEYSMRQILVDVGRSGEFCPVEDFLMPLFKSRRTHRRPDSRYKLDQLIISHPHNDHMSSIEAFDEHFYPTLLTVPNDNEGIPDKDKVDWEQVNNPHDRYVKHLREKMLPGRRPPLCSSSKHISIAWLPATDCLEHEDLDKENYANNISIAVYLKFAGHTVLMPGDLMKDGMKRLILSNREFRNWISRGVDFLVAPHHGLRSSFSQAVFDEMPNGKTRCLHIISEKKTTEDSNRQVDGRYSSSDYCEGQNNLSTDSSPVYQRKTSAGHILLDLADQNAPTVEILDTEKLLDRFV